MAITHSYVTCTVLISVGYIPSLIIINTLLINVGLSWKWDPAVSPQKSGSRVPGFHWDACGIRAPGPRDLMVTDRYGPCRLWKDNTIFKVEIIFKKIQERIQVQTPTQKMLAIIVKCIRPLSLSLSLSLSPDRPTC